MSCQCQEGEDRDASGRRLKAAGRCPQTTAHIPTDADPDPQTHSGIITGRHPCVGAK